MRRIKGKQQRMKRLLLGLLAAALVAQAAVPVAARQFASTIDKAFSGNGTG